MNLSDVEDGFDEAAIIELARDKLRERTAVPVDADAAVLTVRHQ